MNRRSFVLLVLACGLWIGCGRKSTTATGPDGSKATVTQKGDDAQITITGAKGKTVRVAGSKSGVALPEGFPNASPFWPGHVEYGHYSLVQAEALRQIAAGLNTYTTAGSWSTVTQAYASEALARAGCAYFDNMLRMKTDPVVLAAYNAKHGTAVTEIPITLQMSVGAVNCTTRNLTWTPLGGSPVSGGTDYIRSTDLVTAEASEYADSAADDYIEVYHTCVQDEMTSHDMGLRDLMTHNGRTTATPPTYLLCPNYRGNFYTYAMQKFEEHVKWLKPVMVATDHEYWRSSIEASNTLFATLGLGTATTALENCTRCNDRAGYEAGKDDFAKKLIDMIHGYVPNCIVTFYDVYSGKANFVTELYGCGHYFNYGDSSNSGITVNCPELYPASYTAIANGINPVDQLAIYQAAAATRYETAPENECANYTSSGFWRTRPSALLGAYVWLTHVTTEVQLTSDFDGKIYGTYLTDDQFYDLCYALGRAGAVGFYLYPGYHGDPDCKNDKALARLFPVGIAAFAAARAVSQRESAGGKALRVRGSE